MPPKSIQKLAEERLVLDEELLAMEIGVIHANYELVVQTRIKTESLLKTLMNHILTVSEHAARNLNIESLQSSTEQTISMYSGIIVKLHYLYNNFIEILNAADQNFLKLTDIINYGDVLDNNIAIFDNNMGNVNQFDQQLKTFKNYIAKIEKILATVSNKGSFKKNSDCDDNDDDSDDLGVTMLSNSTN